MNTKNLIFFIAIAASAIVIGILILLPLTGCNEPCCPEIKKFLPAHDWVCPDRGAQLFFTVAFISEGFCDPPNALQSIKIQNITSPADYLQPSDVSHVSTGIYQNMPSGVIIPRLEKTSTIRLTATGEGGCTDTKDIVINVVDKHGRSYHDLCCPYFAPKDHWKINTKIFGPGVYIDKIENKNPCDITVTHLPKTVGLLKHNPPSNISPPSFQLRGHDPNGEWIIEIFDEECKGRYYNKDVCVRVYLMCD